MGLDIYLDSKPRDLPKLAQFRQFWALFRWIESHVIYDHIGPHDSIELDEEHLKKMLEHLNQLTPENCAELFPEDNCSSEDYKSLDSGYWTCVNELKEVVSNLLESFDFDKNTVVFSAWW